jgi:endonuclease YncB( thermonuclease family)
VQLWLGLYKEVTVRIRDIDTPEISKAKCAKEKEFGQKAKDFLKGVLPPESKVKLTKVTEDKYRGRVDAFLQTTDGVDISELLLKERLASPNKGGKKQNWCGPESQEEQVSQSKPRRDIEVDSR